MLLFCKILPAWSLLGQLFCPPNAELTITPFEYDFGTVAIYQSRVQTFSLKNTNKHAKISAVTPHLSALKSPFSYLGGTFPGTGGTCSSNLILKPGQACTVVVQFLPSIPETSTSQLSFSYDNKNKPSHVSVKLRGTGGGGGPPELSFIEGGTYDFLQRPLGYEIRKTFTLANTGQQMARKLSVIKSPEAPFSFAGGVFPGHEGTCVNGGNLPSGGTCTLVISFSATSELSLSDSLVLSAAGSVSPISIELFGQGQEVQSTGTLDLSYGEKLQGIVTTDLSSPTERVTSLVVTGEDSLITAGQTYLADSFDFVVSRYRVNGHLDTSFNTVGSRVIDFAGKQDTVNIILIDEKETVTLVGDSSFDCAVARVKHDGKLDSAFGIGGIKVLDLNAGSMDNCNGAALEESGKIIVAGTSLFNGRYSMALIRLNTDGSLDPSFNTTGKVLESFGSGNTFISAVAIQKDGKIVVAGTSFGSIDYDFFVARYGTDGRLDTSFNGKGYRYIDLAITNDKVTDLVIDQGGNSFLVGRFSASQSEDTVGFAVVKLRSDGALDTSFGTNGKFRSLSMQGQDVTASIKKTANGDLVVAWQVEASGSPYIVNLTKLDSIGATVTSYGNAGTLATQIRGSAGQKPGLALQGDGKILIGGYVVGPLGGDFGIQRLW